MCQIRSWITYFSHSSLSVINKVKNKKVNKTIGIQYCHEQDINYLWIIIKYNKSLLIVPSLNLYKRNTIVFNYTKNSGVKEPLIMPMANTMCSFKNNMMSYHDKSILVSSGKSIAHNG